jgi:two-component system, NtrC family, sensor kinase
MSGPAEHDVTSPQSPTDKRSYSPLYQKFTFLALFGSILPLLLVGWVIYSYYSSFAKARMEDYFHTLVVDHMRLTELYMKERFADVMVTANTHSFADLTQQNYLTSVFNTLNREEIHFIDLGVIGMDGKYISYAGPYDLWDKNYSVTFWFKGLMEQGSYISDMFMGYREEPHFIIGVLREEAGRKWILRATVVTEFLRSIVEDVKFGESGEIFLLNWEGVFQTTPRFDGKLMDRSSLPMGSFEKENGFLILEDSQGGPQQIVAYAWLKNPRWMLAVRQNYDEAFRGVNRANHAMLVFLHLSVLAILVISILTTRHMIQVVKKRDREQDDLTRQLIQASKLASVGELASGVAHEINNPLAIILAQSQLIRDLRDDTENLQEGFREELEELVRQVDSQVKRCSQITQNLLRFSRRIKSKVQMVDAGVLLRESIELLAKRAGVSGVNFVTDLTPGLPELLADPFQLEQVFVNFITNAIDAHENRPYGTIRVLTRIGKDQRGIEIVFADTGSGIPPEHIGRIFDPFFTTKPVGKGTGLGLSISYSIVKALGGEISVTSEPGNGTEFVIYIPFRAEIKGEGAENGVPADR